LVTEETEDSISDKMRKLRLYQDHDPESKKFRQPKSREEKYSQDRICDVLERLQSLAEVHNWLVAGPSVQKDIDKTEWSTSENIKDFSELGQQLN
jgi:hypothetical protein